MAASKVHCTLAVIVVDGNIRSFLYCCSTEIEEGWGRQVMFGASEKKKKKSGRYTAK